MNDINDGKINRIGVTRMNNHGSEMIVEKYYNSHYVIVKFIEHGNRVRTRWYNFVIGKVKNVYDKTVFGVGYIGEGKHKISIGLKYTSQYKAWSSMIQRCYSEKFTEKHPTYKDCIVCEEWLNFQTFAVWYDQNYYDVDGESMCLDKDILMKNNKIYSPETCVFAPKRINSLFVKNESKRGNLPIGVFTHKVHNKFIASCSNALEKKSVYLGCYDSLEKAFNVYKSFKENLIKQTAETYKDKIPFQLYMKRCYHIQLK